MPNIKSIPLKTKELQRYAIGTPWIRHIGVRQRFPNPQVYEYFTVNKLLGNQQFGFRSLHSTALALSSSTSNWWLNMDKGNMKLVVFLDIRKAFYTVNHEILLDKLNCYGIGDEELLFFGSYLRDRTQCCNVNGHISTLKRVTYGVPQGSIFGPLLSIIYMNDLSLFI